jgi:hypothetical protein
MPMTLRENRDVVFVRPKQINYDRNWCSRAQLPDVQKQILMIVSFLSNTCEKTQDCVTVTLWRTSIDFHKSTLLQNDLVVEWLPWTAMF